MPSIYAYAKVNLLLAVEYPPVGGFHALHSVFQTVNLADELDFSRVPRGELAEFREDVPSAAHDERRAGKGRDVGDAEGRGGEEAGRAVSGGRLAFTQAGSAVVVECVPDVGQPCEGNLVFRALDAMERTCRPQCAAADEVLCVRVKKNIPAGGGLGGGSSDAAAAISWYAGEHGIDPRGPQALAVAAELGSDVACFLYGGATLMSGKGERLERLLPPFALPIVLMGDARGNSTPEVYRAFDAAPAAPADPDALVQLMEECAIPSSLARACANNLQEAAFSCNPELRARVERAQAAPDVLAALVTGSGSTSFAICADEAAAQRFAVRAAAYSAWTRVVHAVQPAAL